MGGGYWEETYSKCAGCVAYPATWSADSNTATRPISNPCARGTEMGSGGLAWREMRPVQFQDVSP
jgi:hypothetical protein